MTAEYQSTIKNYSYKMPHRFKNNQMNHIDLIFSFAFFYCYLVAVPNNHRSRQFLLNYISHPILRQFLVASICDKNRVGRKIKYVLLILIEKNRRISPKLRLSVCYIGRTRTKRTNGIWLDSSLLLYKYGIYI